MRTHPLLSSLLLLSLAGPMQAQLDTTNSPSDCSVLLHDGKKLHAERFWRIENERLEYEEDGSLHDLLVSDIRRMNCGEREYEIVSGSIRPVMPVPVSLRSDTTGSDKPVDLYALGKADAAKYYNGGGAFAAGFLTAPLLLVPPIIAAVPPHLNTSRNPNAALYRTSPDYLKGYRKKAHENKAGFTILGMTIGLTLILGLANAM